MGWLKSPFPKFWFGKNNFSIFGSLNPKFSMGRSLMATLNQPRSSWGKICIWSVLTKEDVIMEAWGFPRVAGRSFGGFDISQRGGNMTGNGGWCLSPVEVMQTIFQLGVECHGRSWNASFPKHLGNADFYILLKVKWAYISISDGNMTILIGSTLPRSATSRKTATRRRTWFPSSAALTSLGPMGGCLMGRHHGLNHPVFPSQVHFLPLMIPKMSSTAEAVI